MKTLLIIGALAACMFNVATAAVAPACKSACLLDYKPVCVIYANGTRATYTNTCVAKTTADCLGIKIISETQGECPKECLADCPLIYDPVCVTDTTRSKRSYANLCSAVNARCRPGAQIPAEIIGGKCIDPCVTFCTLEYAPICVIDAYGVQYTFDNKCFLEIAVCQKRIDLTKAKSVTRGKCQEKCIEACTFNYDPVCAVDAYGVQTTYSNICALNAAVCKSRVKYTSTYKGECIKQCPGECGPEYEPICVTDQYGNNITFPNPCVFEKSQCIKKFEYKEITKGECYAYCPRVCPALYAPICLIDENGVATTYENDCVAAIDACKRGVTTVERTNGPCCNITCTKEYQPICVTFDDGDTVEFPNKCYLEVALCWNRNSKIKEIRDGSCKPVECPRCFYTVPPTPVCARNSDGKIRIFPGSCDVINTNKCEGTDYKEVDFAECLVECGACKDTDYTSIKPFCAKSDGVLYTFPGSCSLDRINQCLNTKLEVIPCK